MKFDTENQFTKNAAQSQFFKLLLVLTHNTPDDPPPAGSPGCNELIYFFVSVFGRKFSITQSSAFAFVGEEKAIFRPLG